MALTKFCPIMSRRGYGLCIRERCAWWSEWGRCCCIPMLAETLCDQAAQDCVYAPDVQPEGEKEAT